MPEQAIVISNAEDRRLLDTIKTKTGHDAVRIALLRQKMASSLGCTADDVPMRDVLLFAMTERTLGLDALLNQIYWLERGGKRGHQVGIDGLRSIADRSGTYAGSEAAIFRGSLEQPYGKDGKVTVPEEASVTVRKLVDGHVTSFTATVYWVEYYPGDKLGFMYRDKPRLMLGKDAESQALRKAFPAQLGGVPYSSQIEVAEVAPPPTQSDAAMYERIYGHQDEDLDEGTAEPPSGQEQPSAGLPVGSTPWPENSRLSQEAEALGLRPHVLRNDTPLVQVEAYNAELTLQIAEARARR